MMKSYETEENDVKGMTIWMTAMMMIMVWYGWLLTASQRCNELRIGMYKRATVERELKHNNHITDVNRVQ